MKKFILVLFILAIASGFSVVSRSDTDTIIVIQSTSDDCSGNLSFSWHAEDVDVTADSPVGCSDGDSVASANNSPTISGAQFSDGNESVYIEASGADYYSFDVSSNDIASDTAGTVTLDIYITTWDNYQEMFTLYADANNKVQLEMSGTDELAFSHCGNSTCRTVYTPAANLALSTWYTVTMKWRQGASNPSLYIEANSSSATTDTDLVDFTTELGTDDFRVGDWSGQAGVYYVDLIKVYSTWQ